MSLFKRIKEINGKFIPQKLTIPFGWIGVDKKDGSKWLTEKGQFSYCSYDTLEEARKGFVKIHKWHE